MGRRAHVTSPTAAVAALLVCLYLPAAAAYWLGRIHYRRSPDDSSPSADFNPEDVVLDPTDFPIQRGATTAPIDLEAALPPAPQALSRGKQLFEQNCVSCHGPLGRGDGPAGRGLTPPPRNLASPDNWEHGYTMAAVFSTISTGIPGTSMVAFDTLPPSDRFALAHYVQSLGAFPHVMDPPQRIAELDKEYRLTQGVQMPNRAPVSAVVRRMVVEYTAPAPIVLPSAEPPDAGALLLRRAVQDPVRAATALLNINEWRTDMSALSAAIVAGAPENGFSPIVVTLTDSERGVLQQALDRGSPGR